MNGSNEKTPEGVSSATVNISTHDSIIPHTSDADKVDRIELIDETGRAYVKGSIYGSPVRVELSYQDNMRTLKIFVRGGEQTTVIGKAKLHKLAKSIREDMEESDTELYDCVLCDNSKIQYDLKLEKQVPCSCVEQLENISVLMAQREKVAYKAALDELEKRAPQNNDEQCCGDPEHCLSQARIDRENETNQYWRSLIKEMRDDSKC